ncbi:hypothetical protein RHODGE_RHODGE_01327 [Rhodoplanes serenus]|uniref:Uncharacterized protein n=1 Tax=Rhodoplanes serenus TaxID=200615 RepID=A0A447CNF1_9BRAD|nr:DUF5335 domain-containing protein [Rhodoplanes serenus]VCU06680.1 hypothetical protein RHODGE_RHODGE_01327 [Rhodoplanes serenus]
MSVRQLSKSEWQSYCDRVSKGLQGKCAQIEVAALPLGDQIATKWVPILGITYDPRNDIVDIALEGLDHLIHRPRSMAVDEGATGLSSMEIIDGEGRKQIVKLAEPLMLPPPGR